jgi:hypothetical protein
MLHAYQLEIRGGEQSTVGGKLCYRLKNTLGGRWAWAGSNVVTDSPQDKSRIMKVVETLWSEQPEIFKGLRDVSPLQTWVPDPKTISEFVARALLSDLQKNIQGILVKRKHDLGNAFVERQYELRGWVVNGEPSVSLSLSSRLVLKEDLRAYANRVSPDSLIGLQVADKTGTLKGELIEIVGTLAQERKRLVSITQREEMQAILSKSADSDLVVKVSNGRSEYDYAIGALRIILYLEYLHKFNISSRKALAALKIEPQLRAEMVKDVSRILIETGYIESAYNSRSAPKLFRTSPHMTNVRFGDGTTALYKEQNVLNDLRSRHLYRVAAKFKNGSPIKIGFLNALKRSHNDLWELIERSLRSLGFNVQKLGEATIKEPSRAELESVVTTFQSQEPDILLAFFPDDFADEDDDESAYYHFKSLTVGRGIPSQVIEESTLGNERGLAASSTNIVLGILGKTGNIPYILANPLAFADVVVGIDIARDKKKRLSGSMNATAIARIYLNDGDLLQYVIHDAPLEGETIPPSVLQALFPKQEFANKRVVVQRDGYFRGAEKSSLLNWASKIQAQFYLVEVIKTGSPRIYRIEDSQAVQPYKGSAFLINEREALVVSSLPPFKDATPQPLRVRTEAPFPIENAIESVLALTNLHYGSLRAPRLPVTIHYSDKIAYMALRGIKPKNLEGNIPFWL